MATHIISRNDTAANWTARNPTPLKGELCIESDTNKAKVGDGATPWLSLAYFVDTADGGGGVTWYTGSSIPSDGLGSNGDFYLRSNGHVYTKAAGTWTDSGTNLTGPTGAAGADGADILPLDNTFSGANTFAGDVLIRQSGSGEPAHIIARADGDANAGTLDLGSGSQNNGGTPGVGGSVSVKGGDDGTSGVGGAGGALEAKGGQGGNAGGQGGAAGFLKLNGGAAEGATGSDGGSIDLSAKNNVGVGVGGVGGAVILTGGTPDDSSGGNGGAGGAVYGVGGNAGSSVPGGDAGTITLNGGNANSSRAGGSSGSIDLSGSNATSSTAGRNGGSIDLRGGTPGSAANGGLAGSVNLKGGDAAGFHQSGGNAGSLDMHGADYADGGAAAGSINTSAGGGSIDTRGTGSIQLGVLGTRTTLTGTATVDRAIALPDVAGTLALTSVVPIAKVMNADQSLSSETTLQDITDLVFAIEQTRTRVYEFTLYGGDAYGNTGFKLAAALPAGATGRMEATQYKSIAGAGEGTPCHLETTDPATGLDFSSLYPYVVGNDGVIKGTLTVFNDTAVGNVQLQFAQSVSDPATLTLKKGSFCIEHRVS